MTAVVYTDASHDQRIKIATCGYCIVLDGKLIKHEVYLYENVRTNNDAETLAITIGLQQAFAIKGVNTDFIWWS